MLRSIVALLLVLISACATGAPEGDILQHCQKAVAMTFHGDVTFTPEEREAHARGTQGWKEFSSGLVNVSVIYDLDFNDMDSVRRYGYGPVVVRVGESNELVIAQDKVTRERIGNQQAKTLGWTSGVRIYLIWDRIPNMQGVFEHEVGHAVGMRWPNCNPEKQDCFHSPSTPALMNAIDGNSPDFTGYDLDFCRASCLCK